LTTVARFEIGYRQVLNSAGQLVAPLPAFAQDHALLARFYRAMVRTRTFDSKAITLQRTGKLGTFASSLGQEAIGVGVGSAMAPDDVLLPSYRDYAAQLWRGVTLEEILLYWSGDERGSDFAVPRQDFPICVPIGTQIGHAAGVATAFNLRREKRAAVCMFGDGATSKGDFYESLNLAGLWNLPVIFLISNNQWAISVHRSRQTGALTLAQKAVAGGIEGLQVDGNDVIAIHAAVSDALAKAKSGGGATVIEAVTYRLGDHTTADDASRYREAEEVQRMWALDPLSRLRNYLFEIGAWGPSQEETWARECAEDVQAAVDRYLATPPLPPEAMFDFLYATLPPVYQEQRNEVAARGKEHG
jgi:pyruvate dehydrogenase E1 component alpha subunit